VRGDGARPADPGMPDEPVIVLGLLSLCGLAAVGMLVERLRRRVRRAPPARAPGTPDEDAIEEELQAMIRDAHAAGLPERAP